MSATGPSPEAVAQAFGVLAQALAAAAPAAQLDPDGPADLKGSGFYRQALSAIRAGELPAFRVPGARSFYVSRRDFAAWLARPEHRVRPAIAAPEPAAPADPQVAAALAAHHARAGRRGRR